mgnify:CR=1 FL=1
MKTGEKYLSGKLNMGVLGNRRIMVFKNQNRKNEKAPTHNICVQVENEETGETKLHTVGVLWKQKKKAPKTEQSSNDDF